MKWADPELARQIRCFSYGERSDVTRLQQVEQKAVRRQRNLGLPVTKNTENTSDDDIQDLHLPTRSRPKRQIRKPVCYLSNSEYGHQTSVESSSTDSTYRYFKIKRILAQRTQALVSFKKYMPPPLPYFKVNIYPLPLPHFASIFFAYL